MVFGGRHLAAQGEPSATLRLALDGREIAALSVDPGHFLEFLKLPSGTLAGEGRYAELTVSAEAAGPGSAPRVALEQFNLQAPGVVQFGFDDGWLEPEYNPRTARSWRWMSENAALRIHNASRDAVISIRGESPMRYYDTPPVLRVVAGDSTLGEFRPATDFHVDVKVPAAALQAAGGRVQLQSSEHFVPGDWDGSADRRHLALRIYSVRVGGLVP